MHKKILLSLALASILAFCKELKNEQFELIAENINTQNNTLTAKGNVIVYSSTYYLSADKIIYDKQSESFELFNNVVIIKDNNMNLINNHQF
jgi:LPS-assembly protein